MSNFASVRIPARPRSQWPIGARLRFKTGAELAPGYQSLCGTAVLVLSELKLVGPSGPEQSYSWRQEVLAMALGSKLGLARPDQLELPDDGDDLEVPYAAHRSGTGQKSG